MKIILSIKPEFVEKIFSGEKKYEYRKILFKHKVDKVYIYASRPISKIVGEFKVEDIICDTPEHVWALTKKQSGVSRNFYDKYYNGKEKAVAYILGKVKKYDNEKQLSDFHINVPPQSYFYLD